MTEGQPLNPEYPGQHAIPYEVIQRAVVDSEFRSQLLNPETRAEFNTTMNLGIRPEGLEFLDTLDTDAVDALLYGFEQGLFM